MKTTKACSTISYNTLDFLKYKLDQLVQRRYISFYAFVKHYAEEDERKDHIHLIVIPNGQIQTDTISDILQELDSANPLKQLGVMPWRSSKWADWYLYSSHDKAYLASKGQSRKYHYTRDDVVCSDTDILNEEIHQMDMSKLSKVKALNQAISDGVPFEELLARGQIPVQQVYAFRQTYDLLQAYYTNRNGRQTHQKIDPDTGELLI